jgi:hypothetical protein
MQSIDVSTNLTSSVRGRLHVLAPKMDVAISLPLATLTKVHRIGGIPFKVAVAFPQFA